MALYVPRGRVAQGPGSGRFGHGTSEQAPVDRGVVAGQTTDRSAAQKHGLPAHCVGGVLPTDAMTGSRALAGGIGVRQLGIEDSPAVFGGLGGGAELVCRLVFLGTDRFLGGGGGEGAMTQADVSEAPVPTLLDVFNFAL